MVLFLTKVIKMKLNPVGLDKDKTSQKVGTSSAEEIDFLDVPTFMRKQVD